MDLRKLTYFVRISEDGSLTRAAGVLRVAQPALSRQLRLLEEELGATLFNRTKRGMTLTQNGDFLYSSIVGPLRDLDRALLNFRSFSSGIDGTFSIGMPPEVGALIAPRFIEGIKQVLPGMKPRIVEGYSGHLRDIVTRGIIDFAIVEGAWNQGALPSYQVFSDSLVLIGQKSAGLTTDCPITFKDAARLPLIVPCQPFGIRTVLNEAALKHRTTINVAMEVDSPIITLKIIKDNAFYTMMPKSYFLDIGENQLSFTDIASSNLQMALYLTSRGHWSETRKGARGLDKILTGFLETLFQSIKATSSKR